MDKRRDPPGTAALSRCAVGLRRSCPLCWALPEAWLAAGAAGHGPLGEQDPGHTGAGTLTQGRRSRRSRVLAGSQVDDGPEG